jgi:predicted small integral membrane protein
LEVISERVIRILAGIHNSTIALSKSALAYFSAIFGLSRPVVSWREEPSPVSRIRRTGLSVENVPVGERVNISALKVAYIYVRRRITRAPFRPQITRHLMKDPGAIQNMVFGPELPPIAAICI